MWRWTAFIVSSNIVSPSDPMTPKHKCGIPSGCFWLQTALTHCSIVRWQPITTIWSPYIQTYSSPLTLLSLSSYEDFKSVVLKLKNVPKNDGKLESFTESIYCQWSSVPVITDFSSHPGKTSCTISIVIINIFKELNFEDTLTPWGRYTGDLASINSTCDVLHSHLATNNLICTTHELRRFL